MRAIEHSPYLNRKVRLPGQRVRLPFQGWEMNRTGYVGCHVRTVGAALDAWEARGVEGLADLPQKGNGHKLHNEVLKFLQAKLAEDRCWRALQLVEAIAETFGLRVDEEGMGGNLKQLEYAWKRDRYGVAGHVVARRSRIRDAEKGTQEGRIVLKYLDESGFGLSLPSGYSWIPKGQRHQRVPKYFGGAGRINLVGAWEYPLDCLEYAVLQGKGTKEAIFPFLQAKLSRPANKTASPSSSWTTPASTRPSSSRPTSKPGKGTISTEVTQFSGHLC